MPNSENAPEGATGPGMGNLRGFLEALGGKAAKSPPERRIDPEKTREALKGALRVVLAPDERGERCRAALKRIGSGLADLLRALAEE